MKFKYVAWAMDDDARFFTTEEEAKAFCELEKERACADASDYGWDNENDFAIGYAEIKMWSVFKEIDNSNNYPCLKEDKVARCSSCMNNVSFGAPCVGTDEWLHDSDFERLLELDFKTNGDN